MFFWWKTDIVQPVAHFLMSAAASLSPHASSEYSATSAASVDCMVAVQNDVERRLRAVTYMESVLAKSSSSFCSLELSPLLQMRKRPLEEMKRRCAMLAEYGVKNNLW